MRIAIIISTIFLLTSCGLECIDKKTGLHKSSQTLSESKEHDVFKFEMLPDKNSFSLKSGSVFKIENAWVESSWSYECVNNSPVIQKDTYDQLVIEAKYNGMTTYSDYYLKQIGAGQSVALGSQLDFQYSGQDTFIILLANHHMLNKFKDKSILDTIKLIKKVSH